MSPKSHTLTEIREVFSKFFPDGRVLRIDKCMGGHINETYFIDAIVGGVERRFVEQLVNTHVFTRVRELMDNVVRISEHIERKTAGNPMEDHERNHLHFFRTIGGDTGVDMGDDGFWRLYRYVGRAVGRTQATSPAEARVAAAAFGRFQALLADMPEPRLAETIPYFHDTRRRYDTLEAAAQADIKGRRVFCKDVFAGLMDVKDAALSVQKAFEAGLMPERIVHNDAKYANILLDEVDSHAVCVVDLDTCMPGLSLHDFGDLMRSMCSSAAEDERDVSLVVARMDMYEALRDGFLSETDSVLTPTERELLPYGGICMTAEVGVRFLTDYLEGDHYFHIDYPEHNLVRAISQLALVRSMLDTYIK